MRLVPLSEITAATGASRHTMKSKCRLGLIAVAARTDTGRLLLTEAEAARVLALHSEGRLLRRYSREGKRYQQARRAARRAQRQQAAAQDAGQAVGQAGRVAA